MKKTKLFLSAGLLALASGALIGCGGQKETITVWVGEESAAFYQIVANEYLAAHPDFKFDIKITGVDTGTVAGTITNDPQAAGDIYTVAHDNVGKMAAQKCAKPITAEALSAQILADNPESFKNVVYSTVDGVKSLYAAPYISQALFLYYNKAYVTDTQAQSFEGLFEAAKAKGGNTKAFTVTGDDGYNFSFALLAHKVADKSTTVKIYEGATTTTKGESNCQGDDTIALFRWMQDAQANPNGFKWASSDGWDADLRNGGVVASIGGAWHFNSAKAAVSETNLGIALLPTMTLTDSNVAGLTGVKAGDVYRGGTFADCKVFMINAYSSGSKYQAEQELIKYFSSKDIQNRSFKEVMNVPAYVGASEYIKSLKDAGEITELQYNLASKQVEMAEWGIPQPFLTGTLNTYFYSKNAPAVMRAVVDKTQYPSTGDVILSDTTSLEGMRKAFYMVEYIWMHGKNPDTFPTTLPVKA